MKIILVTVKEESLLATIEDVLSTVTAEMVKEPEPTLDQVEQIMPAMIIVDYTEGAAQLEDFFYKVSTNEATTKIPFMFIVPETGKWNEIENFRLGFDTKVSKEHPKLGIQLRVQAILKKSREEDSRGKTRDLQQVMQGIMKKTRNLSDELGSLVSNSSTKTLPQRPKVLIVEDEPPTRDVLQAALEIKYELIFANDGAKGYEEAISNQPDLIISDYMMPNMNGMQLLEKVRATTELKRVPFIFLTAKNRVEDRIEGLELGANEYLSKPFSVRELQLRVDRLVEDAQLRRNSGALQGQLQEIALPDILQIIGNNRKSGELIITTKATRDPVKLYFQEGAIINARYAKLSGLKALFRTLSLEEGNFVFENKTCYVKPIINDKMENLLLEGYRQIDEFEMLRTRFTGGLHAQLRAGTEKAVQSGLSPVDALVLFAVGGQATVQEVLDKVTYTDFEAMESIINLLDIRLIVAD